MVRAVLNRVQVSAGLADEVRLIYGSIIWAGLHIVVTRYKPSGMGFISAGAEIFLFPIMCRLTLEHVLLSNIWNCTSTPHPSLWLGAWWCTGTTYLFF
jgi:hypothetical protein